MPSNATINVNKQIEYKAFVDDLMKIITLTANKLGLDELNNHENYPSLIVTGTITDISTAQKLENPINVFLTQVEVNDVQLTKNKSLVGTVTFAIGGNVDEIYAKLLVEEGTPQFYPWIMTNLLDRVYSLEKDNKRLSPIPANRCKRLCCRISIRQPTAKCAGNKISRVVSSGNVQAWRIPE